MQVVLTNQIEVMLNFIDKSKNSCDVKFNNALSMRFCMKQNLRFPQNFQSYVPSFDARSTSIAEHYAEFWKKLVQEVQVKKLQFQ